MDLYEHSVGCSYSSLGCHPPKCSLVLRIVAGSAGDSVCLLQPPSGRLPSPGIISGMGTNQQEKECGVSQKGPAGRLLTGPKPPPLDTYSGLFSRSNSSTCCCGVWLVDSLQGSDRTWEEHPEISL